MNLTKWVKIRLKKITLNSIKDNKKFEINSVELLYSLPIDSFTMINDEKDNIYLAKIKKFYMTDLEINNNDLNEYTKKENSNTKNSILKVMIYY